MKKESAFSDDYEICLLNEYLTCTVWLSVLSTVPIDENYKASTQRIQIIERYMENN